MVGDEEQRVRSARQPWPTAWSSSTCNVIAEVEQHTFKLRPAQAVWQTARKIDANAFMRAWLLAAGAATATTNTVHG